MGKNRKSAYCLNCGQELSNEENFCPNCGQENKDQRVSIVIFLRDFISSYLSFETTFFRTVKPFLFRPGKLTEAFNRGKRTYYIHPIRLYLIFSLFYFFVLGLVIPKTFLDDVMNSAFGDVELRAEEASSKMEREDEMAHPDLSEISNYDTLSNSKTDTSTLQHKWKQIKFSALDNDITNEQFAQILKKHNIYMGEILSIENQRSFIANSNFFMVSAARNLPIMMFLLLPFFAGILMLLHLSSKRFYVEHLIHGLNLHSFAYFIYGTGILILLVLVHYETWVFNCCFLIVTIYAYLSIKRVYKNGWLRSFLKFLVLGLVYFSLLLIGLALELYFSLLML